MENIVVSLPYGDKTVQVAVPSENLIGVYSPKDVTPVADVIQEVIRALNQPIGTKKLRELAAGAQKAVIVADDNTRLTPTEKIIPILLDEMNAAGIADEQITIINDGATLYVSNAKAGTSTTSRSVKARPS